MKAGIAAALDQALLSAVSLGVSVAFIKFGSKDAYGLYVMLLAPVLLVHGVLNALLLSPFATLHPQQESGAAQDMLLTARGAILSASAVLACVGVVALLGYLSANDAVPSPVLLVAFGCALLGVGLREGARSISYVVGRTTAALLITSAYTLTVLVGVGFAITFGSLSHSSALAITGIASICVAAPSLLLQLRLNLSTKHLAAFWACGKWAVVGVVVTWVNLSAYPLIVGFFQSPEEVAEISAARLFMTPVALWIAAWSNVNRPRIARLARAGNKTAIDSLVRSAIGQGVVGTAALTFLVFFAYPFVESWLDRAYAGLMPLISVWALFFAISLTRTFLMAQLLTDADGYRFMQQVSWVALFVSTVGLLVFSRFGVIQVIAVLVAVEAVQLAMVARRATASLRGTAK